MVSSTAVTLSFSRQSRDQATAATAGALAGGILLAWCVMFGRVLVEVLVVNPQLLMTLLAPMAAMGLIAAGAAGLYLWRGLTGQARKAASAAAEVPLTNPFSLAAAAKVAAFFAARDADREGRPGNVSRQGCLHRGGACRPDGRGRDHAVHGRIRQERDTTLAVNAIVIAALANTLVKCGMVLVLAGPPLRRPIALATAAILTAGLAALALG